MGISLISSSRRVPPFANSNLLGRPSFWAPVKAPLSYPKAHSDKSLGKDPQFKAINGLSFLGLFS